jgi:hypothetical protein
MSRNKGVRRKGSTSLGKSSLVEYIIKDQRGKTVVSFTLGKLMMGPVLEDYLGGMTRNKKHGVKLSTGQQYYIEVSKKKWC